LDEFVEAGFIFEDKADFLKSNDDDQSKDEFEQTIRGKADCFVLIFQKPIV
jgi:predicted methyltransferase